MLRLSMVSSWRSWAGGARACSPSTTRPSAAGCKHVGRTGNGGRDGETTTRPWNRVSALISRPACPAPAPAPAPSGPGGPSASSRHPRLWPCPGPCPYCSYEAANPGAHLRIRANRPWVPGAGRASSSYSLSSWGSRGTRASPFVTPHTRQPCCGGIRKRRRRRAGVGEWQMQVQVQGRVQGRVRVQGPGADVSLLARGQRGTGTQQPGRSEHVGCGQRWAAESSTSVAVSPRGCERARGLTAGRRGLNRGLHVRGALRGSQMVSHKWFTATCEVHEWGEGCVDDWRCCAARRKLLQTGTASPPYTRYAEGKRRRGFWLQGGGGDWASVDEALWQS